MPSERIFRVRRGLAGILAAMLVIGLISLLLAGVSGLVEVLWLGLAAMLVLFAYYLVEALDELAAAMGQSESDD